VQLPTFFLAPTMSRPSLPLTDVWIQMSQVLSAGSSSAPVERVDPLVERLAEEMADAWRRGQRPLAEAYLARHPELADRSEAVLRLVYEEVCLRQEWKEDSS